VDFEKKRKLGFVEAVGCCLIKAIFFLFGKVMKLWVICYPEEWRE